MPLTLTQIEHEVEALPMEDKFQLLGHLQDELVIEQDKHDLIWAKEAQRRLDACLNGTTTLIPAEEVFAEALKKYSK
jgi:hypothetical protein